MDPGTGLTVLGGALGSAKVIEKILGPTAEYVGVGLKDWTERSVNNVGRVFEKAQEKLGSRIDQPGSVPPKVLKKVLEEASFSEDELSAEYYGGVLASSRSEVGRDDRGAALIALIGRLTSYQIRSHFFFYSLLRVVFEGLDANLGDSVGRSQCRLFIPFPSYHVALDFSEGENPVVILTHVMFGLSRENLIETDFRFGDVDSLRRVYEKADQAGIIFTPSVLGVELFLWAHGRGDLPINSVLDPSIHLSTGVQIPTVPGIRSISFPDRGYPKPDGVVT
ncbi:MAG TPA: hypothetical protein VIQ76_15925 [Propionibacteriaceae bacterium]|jgi:hypothetical protein